MSHREKLKEYAAIGLVAFAVIAASISLFFLYFKFDTILGLLKLLGGILAPFAVGVVIAYLLSPIYNMMVRNLSDLLTHELKLKEKTAVKLSSLLSAILSVLLLVLLVVGLVALVIPRFTESMLVVFNNLEPLLKTLNERITDLINSYTNDPDLQATVDESLQNLANTLIDWVKINVMPMLQQLSSSVGDFAATMNVVFHGVMAAVNVVKNLLLGIIVAIYMLLEKGTMIAQCKQVIYAVVGQERGNRAMDGLRFTNKVLGGFIRGKLLDSLIIGVLCFVGTSLLKLPYPVLLAVIVGVTNIIPFFGPIIGAVPCALLILMNNPIQTIPFIIFVLVLQQFDGNVLGPKILGDTTGLSSFWVLFAILLFGGLFGFVGMLVGVPLFAVIYTVVGDLIRHHLGRKQLSEDGEDYVNLDKVEQTGEGYTYSKLADPTKKN